MPTTRVNRLMVSAALVILATGAACTTPAEQPTSRPASLASATPSASTLPATVSVNAIMVALVDHAAHELWSAEKTPPTSDAAWREVEHHAIQLAAAGPALTLGGTGTKDKDWVSKPLWAAHAQRETDAALLAIAAARAKNFDALVTANGRLVDACEACHREFKPDLPTEGMAHPH